MSGKPLGHRAYGSIPHLPGSRLGDGDHHIHEGQAAIATTKARDKHDLIVVQEKLDGSCCSVARVGENILALGRAGYLAVSSPYEQHHLFAAWVGREQARFRNLLYDGERAVGEWMALAHGTRYDLPHEPFVIFDIMRKHTRLCHWEVYARCTRCEFTNPRIIHRGGPLSVDAMLAQVEPSGHGAIDPVEGAVWRVERGSDVSFLTKYVRAEKIDGKYLPEVTGAEPLWNWMPEWWQS